MICAYDANGNTSSKTDSSAATNYSWDFESRDDPFGRRIYESSSNGTSIYAYDGANLVEETNSSGAAVARYSQGLDLDEPLAMFRGGTTTYKQVDRLGSLTSLSNTSGTLANTYTYDSFGNLVASSDSLVNSFRYTGREFDTESSLYYYRARYYDPSTGRFLSEDRPNSTANIHSFYPYVRNNPLLWTDPTGLVPQPIGPPPVPVPGAGPGNGWKWNPDPGNPRGGTWGPQTPVPGGQPGASWDPEGHWDVDDGKGNRRRYDPDGNPLTPEDAHRRIPVQCPRSPGKIPVPNLTPVVTTIVVGIVIIAIRILILE